MSANANTDQNLLSCVAEQLRENLGLETIHAVADKGYDSRADIEKCVENGIIPDVGFKYDKEARVMLTIKRDIPKQQLRKETVEHPFGTIKWYHCAHYFLCRGKEKVTAEIALSFTGYNMRRAINMIGVPGIVMHLRGKMTEKAG